MSRKAKVKRVTRETDISLELAFPDSRESKIESGVPFFDHMLNSMCRHGRFYLSLVCKGDTEIDDHHSVEDIGICLGQAFKEALGEKKGIYRFGEAAVPMDESLTQTVVDLSGRPYFSYSGTDLKGNISAYNAELTLEFIRAFADNAMITLHIRQLSGTNSHHIHESIFKALGIALYRAYSIDPANSDMIPSTKGTIV